MQLNVNRLTIGKAVEAIEEALKTSTMVKVTITDPSIGKWSMTRLWRSWMGSTATYMAARGAIMPILVNPDGTYAEVRPFNANDCHELFSRKWLGTDSNGNRFSWSKEPEDGSQVADKGQRFYALEKHEIWMADRGITYINPRDSDFRSLIKSMEHMEGRSI